jgi:integrase
MGHYGILERKSIPTLAQFIRERIEPKVKESDVEICEQRRPKRFRWLCTALKPLSTHAIGRLPLDKITSEHVSDYGVDREAKGLAIGTVNRELRVLRRILRLAVEWNIIEKSPKIAMAGNEPFRVRVVADAELARYLICANPLLADVATILNDRGLRPDELHHLRWEDITFVNGRHRALSVHYGKTDAARRTLPMTPRVRGILEARQVSLASPPADGYCRQPAKAATSAIPV